MELPWTPTKTPKGREVLKKTENSALDRNVEMYNQYRSGGADLMVLI